VSRHSRVAHCPYFLVRSFVSDLTVNLSARSHCIVGEEERKEKERRGKRRKKINKCHPSERDVTSDE
jgi:hypothetical protein